MSEARNTPGPWTFETDSAHNSAEVTVFGRVGPNRKYVCRVYGEGASSKIVSERDANLALIAAAP